MAAVANGPLRSQSEARLMHVMRVCLYSTVVFSCLDVVGFGDCLSWQSLRLKDIRWTPMEPSPGVQIFSRESMGMGIHFVRL